MKRKTLYLMIALILISSMLTSCKKEKYTITYENGSDINTITIDGGSLATNKEVSKTGYRFIGWYDGDVQFDFSKPVKKDTKLVAKFEAINYQITYENDGNSVNNPTSYNIETEDIILLNPTKEGYKFLGWYDGDTKVEKITKGTTGDIKLVARFHEAHKVTIKWGAEFEDEIIYVINGELLDEPETKIRDGYVLKCFEQNGREYDFDKEVYNDIELVAVWLKYYQITINWNVDDAKTIIQVPEGVTLKQFGAIEKPTKEGFVFANYYEDKNLTILFGLEKEVTSNMELYARWYEKYTINYELNGGTCTGLIYEYTVFDKKTNIPLAKKEGYFFRGWYNNPEFNGSRIYRFDDTTTGNFTLFAKWEEANLKNSYISFLGDSISTYYSYTPFTNEENSCYYPKYHELTVEQTWWMMTRNQLGCKLGINNSYSGTCVMNKYGKNSTENISRLEKSRRLDNLPPDIMVVFMGMNDSLAEGVGVAPSDFKTSYRNMINNIYKLYPDVKLFLCTISFEINRNSQSYYEEHVKNTAALNQVIIDLSVEYNLPLIDFRNAFNTRDYLADTVHPNVLGMAELAKVAVSTIREYFDNLENN